MEEAETGRQRSIEAPAHVVAHVVLTREQLANSYQELLE